MPEIVEYHKLAQQLAPAWQGEQIVRISAPASSPNPRKYATGNWVDFTECVKLRFIHQVTRYGKNLFVKFYGHEDLWRIHLSSTGWILPGNDIAKARTKVDPIVDNFLHSVNDANVRVKFTMVSGAVWHYHDARTWGKWEIIPMKGLFPKEAIVASLGYGPDWIFDPKEAKKVLQDHNSGRAVKDVLTDQHITAGIGNYLSCEIAYLAGVHPHQRWNKLSEAKKWDVADAASIVINTSLSEADHKHWNVFDRAGVACRKHPDTKIAYAKDGKTAKRGSYYCPACQPLTPL